MELDVYERNDGRYAWRLTVNGNIVATDGGQGYENKEDCEAVALRVVGGSYTAAVGDYQTKKLAG